MSSTGLSVLERRQEAIDALLGVLNDIGSGQRDNYNVSYEAAGKALDATGLLADHDRAVVDLLREARAILPHGAFAGHRHDERHDLIARIDAALKGQ